MEEALYLLNACRKVVLQLGDEEPDLKQADQVPLQIDFFSVDELVHQAEVLVGEVRGGAQEWDQL